MEEQQQQFLQLLNTLLSTDNDIRSTAEEAYSNIQLALKVTHLLQSIQDQEYGEDVRSMAAILLRRLFSTDFQDFYDKLNPQEQQTLKQQLLLLLQHERSDVVRRRLCDLVAELARNLIDEESNNKWPEFLQFLFQCAQSSDNEVLQDSALRMFSNIPGVFGNEKITYLDVIKQMLTQCLQSPSYQVRFQAVRAAGAFLLLNEKEPQVLKFFNDLLTGMIMVLKESIEKEDDDQLMKLFIEIAENIPKFLRSKIQVIFDLCLSLIRRTEATENWRQLALEIMVTLSENAPIMVKKHVSQQIKQLVPIILEMMTDLDEDPTWSLTDELIDEDCDSIHAIAESALDRLACALGGKCILQQVVEQVSVMLTNSNWMHRHAALMAVSAIGEGCHKQMEGMLDQIVNGIIQFLNDPHPQVRYAACNAIGQMSTDFVPVFEKKFHDRVIPGLLMVLDDNDNPRVQAHAGAALVNFSEDCPKEILLPYMEPMMNKLENILKTKLQEFIQTNKKLVLEQIVTTIASIADTCETDFIPFYDRLLPCLKYIIDHTTKMNDMKLLRGKTIECVSLMGLAVGREKFLPDSNELMQLLLQTPMIANYNPLTDLNQTIDQSGESTVPPDDDPQTSYLISAWTRFCKLMGKDFEQYLPMVMGPVFRTASMKPDVALIDNDDLQTLNTNDDDWQFVQLDQQQNFGIRTAGLEDKATACEMLVCYARELKEGFANYAEATVKLMVPMLKFYFHDEVRSAAADSLPYLLDCAKIKGPRFLRDMWNYVSVDLMKAIETEPEIEVKIKLMSSLANCIETLGTGYLTNEYMEQILELIETEMKSHYERDIKRREQRLDEDYDPQDDDLDEDDLLDDSTLPKVADIIHALFQTYRNEFLPFFDRVLNYFLQLFDKERHWCEQQLALCIFDDLIEFCGAAAFKYKDFFLPPITHLLTHQQPEVRQAAAYGIGLLAQYGGDHFVANVIETIPILVSVIQAPNSRDENNILATENAISALTKILKYQSHHVNNINEILLLWLQCLPITEDKMETPHVYSYLCDLIDNSNQIILGQDNRNVPTIIRIIAYCIYERAISYETEQEIYCRLLSIVARVKANEAVYSACVKNLPAPIQQSLDFALNQFTNLSTQQ